MPGYRGDETVGVSTTPAERGRIMDDNGTALVYNRDVITVGIDKSQFGRERTRATPPVSWRRSRASTRRTTWPVWRLRG